MTQPTAVELIETELIETADVARILKRTPATVRVMVKLGKIPVAVTTPRGARLFRRSDIAAIAQRKKARG